MTQRWFVTRGEHVHGPWSTEDVQSHRRDGNILNSDVIWGVGTAAWVAIANWNPNQRTPAPRVIAEVAIEVAVAAPARAAPARIAADLVAPTGAVAFDEEITKTSAPRADVEEVTVISGPRAPAPEAWHLAFDGRSLGPFTRPALLIELRRLANVQSVSLWTKGMREWAPVTDFLDILNDLGVNQRQHARAAIKGQATLKYDGLSRPVALTSISEGGFGVALDSEMVTGQLVAVEIRSADLSGPVKGTAEIRFCANGIVGLKFTSIDAASRAGIARYVRQHAVDPAQAA